MDGRIFHGNLTPKEVSRALLAHFNRNNWVAQQLGGDDQIVVQIATRQRPVSGGQTALSVTLQKVEDGLAIQIGKQAWLGVAASLGVTALAALRNPFSLLGRLDDLAQDIENLQLTEEVWRVIENFTSLRGASFELSERLKRMVCEYCLAVHVREHQQLPAGRIHEWASPCAGRVYDEHAVARIAGNPYRESSIFPD